MTMPLSESAHVLRPAGRGPSTKAVYGLLLRRTGPAIALELVEHPRTQDTLFTWSKAQDPDLDGQSQILGLIQEALADLDRTLGRFGVKITSVQGRTRSIPVWTTSWFLTKWIIEHRGETYLGQPTPLGQRQAPDHDRILMDLREIDNFYLQCSPRPH